MKISQQLVKDWMSNFGQDCPATPTIPSLEVRKLRAKLILEEPLETIAELGIEIKIKEELALLIYLDKYLDIEFCEALNKPNLVEIADGLADSLFVVLGTAVACGIDIEPIFKEVCRSNNSKLWKTQELTAEICAEYNTIDMSNGFWLVKDSHGKVIKSPSYSPPNIQQLLQEQSYKTSVDGLLNQI